MWLKTSARELVATFASERLVCCGSQQPVERGTLRDVSELGNVVGKTPAAAQRQRGIEPPAAAARAALNRRFYYEERWGATFTS